MAGHALMRSGRLFTLSHEVDGRAVIRGACSDFRHVTAIGYGPSSQPQP
jgi:hypothetical protein